MDRNQLGGAQSLDSNQDALVLERSAIISPDDSQGQGENRAPRLPSPIVSMQIAMACVEYDQRVEGYC